jgi:glycosyltransferase involved in cell wall biosynthesis
MRIGVNALYLIPGGVGGTETYLRSLLAALAEIDSRNEYFLFPNRETGPDLAPSRPNFTSLPQPIHAASRPVRILWEQTGLPINAQRLRLDVMLNPGFTAPLFCSCPQVTVFHDMQHKRHPEYFRWFDLPFWDFFLFWSAKISRIVLADSEATAKDLARYYRLSAFDKLAAAGPRGHPREGGTRVPHEYAPRVAPQLTDSKVRVVPLGVDPVFFELARRRRPEPFLLAVSTLHPHKNLDGLLRAFAVFHQARPEFRLVVCGLHGFFTQPLHELRASLGLTNAVEFPGWIPREELHDLYSRAWAFVYPSLFEGFGLPVLEALAAGVPMACSNIEPISSVAGPAAIQFDPMDQDQITGALLRVTGDERLRAHLAECGPRQAAKFSWKTTAQATLDAICEAAEERLS